MKEDFLHDHESFKSNIKKALVRSCDLFTLHEASSFCDKYAVVDKEDWKQAKKRLNPQIGDIFIYDEDVYKLIEKHCSEDGTEQRVYKRIKEEKIEYSNKFLHRHIDEENTLTTIYGKKYGENHIIVDKKDWERAVLLIHPEILTNLTDSTFKIGTDCGIKYDSDKPRFDLIPADALEEVAKVYTVGAKKYGDRNWEKGISYGRLYRALLGHAYSWWRGERDDKESKCHHLSAVIFNALGLLHYELNSEKFKKFDDRK